MKENIETPGICIKEESLRGKLVRIAIEEFLLGCIFDQDSDDWGEELYEKLDSTFSFKCEADEISTKNGKVSGKVLIEKEDGEMIDVNFTMAATGNVCDF